MPARAEGSTPGWSAWRVVLGFGVVSLAADMVYEGARSVYGPVLLALGASATVVGLVTGAGEAMALMLRLVAGPVADRRGSHWSFTIAGYTLTAVCVPLLAITPWLGAAGLITAAGLILAERAGKAIRSPSKSALLAHAAGAVGRGRGFGVHKALDQLGAFAGPLLVAAVAAATAGPWWALAVLAVPGALALVLLLVIRHAVPDLTVYDPPEASGTGPPAGATSPPAVATLPPAVAAAPPEQRAGPGRWWRTLVGTGLPGTFHVYAWAASLTTGGLVTFGIISVHLTRDLHLSVAQIGLVYAAAMLVEALAALVTGTAYDRWGSRVLLAVPLLVALVPALAFTLTLGLALVGVALWAAAYGIQDSTIKALVADLVPGSRLATAYGVFAAIQGLLAVVGGALAGYLLDRSIPALIGLVALAQLAALLLLVRVTRASTLREQ